MAHLWSHDGKTWTPRALSGEAFPLPGATPAAPTGAVLRPPAAGGPDSDWHLIAPPALAVRINGEPVLLSIRALRDRDEICVAGSAPVFLSLEQLVSVERFAGAREAKCPRCTKIIEQGAPSVRCPGCGSAYHQLEARPCFTYGDHPICVVCGADAVVSGEFAWSPEDI